MFRPCWSGWRTAIGLSHRPRDGNVVSSLHCMNDPQPEGHMASYIERRKFLATLGGVAGWPDAEHAQQAALPVVGFLPPVSVHAAGDQMRAFHQGLKEAGFVDGENVAIEYRWADNRTDRLPALAAELVRRRVAVIATVGTSAFAVKAA